MRQGLKKTREREKERESKRGEGERERENQPNWVFREKRVGNVID